MPRTTSTTASTGSPEVEILLPVGLDENAGMSVKQRAHGSVSDTVMQTRETRDSLRSSFSQRQSWHSRQRSCTSSRGRLYWLRRASHASRPGSRTSAWPADTPRTPRERHPPTQTPANEPKARQDCERIGCSLISSKTVLACVTLPSKRVMTQRHRAPLV